MRRRLPSLLIALAGCASSPGEGSPPPASTTGPATADDDSTGMPVADGSSGAPVADDSTGTPMGPSDWLCPAAPEPVPYVELGWDYKDGWIDLEPGGPVPIIIGHQGAWMVPLGVRGDGFCVPADPTEYEHVPSLDITIEAEGVAEPVAFVYDFPVSFVPLPQGGLGYTFIPMIIVDGLDVNELEGQPTTIHAELRAQDVAALQFTLQGTLTVSE